MTEDITFCQNGWEECLVTRCERHPSNIENPQIPHSYAKLYRTEYCPLEKPQPIDVVETPSEAIKALSDVPDTNVGDTISRQAAIDVLEERLQANGYSNVTLVSELNRSIGYLMRLPSAQPEPRWIPVKFRPMDSEEREYWDEQLGGELADEDAVMFDCPMPEDGQEILVSYRKWISMDKCEIDGGCYGLEGNGDWDGVIAWMPLPNPYKENT